MITHLKKNEATLSLRSIISFSQILLCLLHAPRSLISLCPPLILSWWPCLRLLGGNRNHLADTTSVFLWCETLSANMLIFFLLVLRGVTPSFRGQSLLMRFDIPAFSITRSILSVATSRPVLSWNRKSLNSQKINLIIHFFSTAYDPKKVTLVLSLLLWPILGPSSPVAPTFIPSSQFSPTLLLLHGLDLKIIH